MLFVSLKKKSLKIISKLQPLIENITHSILTHDSCAVGVDGGFARPPARGPDTPARCGRSPDVQGATKATRTSKKRKRKRFAGRRKCVICCCNGGRKANDNEKDRRDASAKGGDMFFRTAAGASRRNAIRHARNCVPSVPRGWGILR